jgi:hypothetical protein
MLSSKLRSTLAGFAIVAGADAGAEVLVSLDVMSNHYNLWDKERQRAIFAVSKGYAAQACELIALWNK